MSKSVSSSISSGLSSGLVSVAAQRPGDDPIFTLHAEALRRAATGEKIINATVGALLDDEGQLSVMPAVFDAFRAVDPKRAAAYAPIAGDKVFLDGVTRDVFGEGELAASSVAVATAGGTGAIHHAFVNFLDPGEAVLTTDLHWAPYGTIADHTRRTLETFEMFDEDGRFHMVAFERALTSLIERQGRALVLLNFPCNNPTGYSLHEDEWREVAGILRRAGERAPVTLLMDLAYARYGSDDADSWVEWSAEARQTCTLLVAWSASKGFAQYGSRVGALLAITPRPEDRVAVRNALSYSCRGTWSNCNHLGLLAIAALLTDADLVARVQKDRQELIDLLSRRVEVFNEAASNIGLATPRYEGGFFVSAFSDDPQRTLECAREAGVFVVPIPRAVRVAICAVPTADIPRLVEVLHSAVLAAKQL